MLNQRYLSAIFLLVLLHSTCGAVNKTEIIATPTTTSVAVLNHTDTNHTQTSNGSMSQDGTVHHSARSMNILPQPSHTATASSSATSTSSFVIILVSLIVVACIITVIIAALFVMRHRFSTWRLNGGNTGGKSSSPDAENNDGTSSNDKLTGETAQAEDGAVEAKESTAKTLNEIAEQLTSIDNKQAIVQIESETAEMAKKTEAEATTAAVETPLLTNAENNVAVITTETTEAAATAQVTEQVSSTSLIANVLNELSESVVCKLATKSPAKSDDPEKQPLNSEQ